VTTTSIAWNWGTNTDINFNAATDVLDFGWFAADQFTISEINGTVVIAIPSNHQTYTLQHTTLSDLHLSNIVAKDASAISEWTTVLGSAPVVPAPPEPPVAPPITPPVVPPDSSAAAWSANTVYTAGMTATEKRRHLQSQLVDAGRGSRPQQRRLRHRAAVDHRRDGRCIA
jgi:hypothetical protein